MYYGRDILVASLSQDDPKLTLLSVPTNALREVCGTSKDVQVVRRHNLAVVCLPDFREKNVIRFLSHRSTRAISAMIEDK